MKAFVYIIVMSFLCGKPITFSPASEKHQQQVLNQQKVLKDAAYSKVDFFSDPQKLFCWSSQVINFNMTKSISELPVIVYNDETVGNCRILCYPKKGLAHWESTIEKVRKSAGKNRLDAEHKFVGQIATDARVASEYEIYAFFIEAKDLVQTNNQDEKEPKFPCWEFIYQRRNNKWLFIKKVRVLNFGDKANLEFDMISNKR